jgi:broad specificity phosphatase PhoE
MTHLILVRHGESELNVVNRHTRTFCGQFDTPLTERGRQQARDAARRLLEFDFLRITRAVSAALPRAHETLDLILQGLAAEILRLDSHALLNERSLGAFEGLTEADVFAQYPHYRDDPKFRDFQNCFVQKAPGGENLAEVTARAWPVVAALLAENAGDILVVAHFNTIRCILGQALLLSQAEVKALRIQNAEPIIVRWGQPPALVAGNCFDAPARH